MLNEDDPFKDLLNIKEEENEKDKNSNNNENIRNDSKNDFTKDINNKFTKDKNSKKFFTDSNYGMKCSCLKAQCNKNYCECFSSRRYCINCNCKDCLNKPPKNSTSDIHILENENKNSVKTSNIKDKKVFCTCSKSECKFNYCECFKIKQECNELCRCTNCKNSNNPKINNKYKFNKACFVNSIYIINNELYEGKNIIKNNNKKFLNKKKKKINKNKNKLKGKKNKDIKSNKNNSFNGELFDKNGNMIFKYINLNEFKKFQNL